MTTRVVATLTKTAIFDAFGTVVRIGRRTNPYRQLLREGIKQGRRPHPGDAHVIMTLNLELHELAEHLGIRISESRRVEIECALQAELNSIEAYPDAIEAVAMLRERGVALGICSNLAKPYGAAVKRLFPRMDAYALRTAGQLDDPLYRPQPSRESSRPVAGHSE